MTNSSSDERSPQPNLVNTADPSYVPPTPIRCFTGALISGGFGTALYFLTVSIAETFASKPIIATGNQLAMKIGVAVRTLVVGLSTMVTAIFAIATLGLIALGIQLIIQKIRNPESSN